MTNELRHHPFGRLLQAGAARGVCLVRIDSHTAFNRYGARPVELTDDGGTVLIDDAAPLEVLNLAELSDAGGGVAAGTETLAWDLHGRWVICVRQAGAALFPAKVIDHVGGNLYTVREQRMTAQGDFFDLPGATDIEARNIPEATAGAGGAVDADTIVMVTTHTTDDLPPVVLYVFTHTNYAKYYD